MPGVRGFGTARRMSGPQVGGVIRPEAAGPVQGSCQTLRVTDPYAQRPGDPSRASDQSPSFDRSQPSGPNPFQNGPSLDKGSSSDVPPSHAQPTPQGQPGSSYGQSSPTYGSPYGQPPSFDQGRQADQGQQPYAGSQPYGGSQPYEQSQPYDQTAYGAPQPYAAAASADPWQQGGGYPAADPSAAPPKSNVGWAVAAVIFFWPLAFSAFTHALDVFPAWSRGDFAGALYHSQRVRTLGLWALAIWAVIFVLMAIAYIGLIVVAVGAASSTSTW